jgi:DNA processing protein
MAQSLTSSARELLALHLVPGLGPRLTTALIKRFGTAAEVLRAGAVELQEVPHIGAKLAANLCQAMRHVDVDAELQWMERTNVRLLVRGTPDYPAALEQIQDPPYLLYIRGQYLPRDSAAVALVGSRHCTAYGRRMAERLAGELARAGLTVVSGLARGIDGVAHRAALNAGGRTVAVLAGGLARIYPPEHADLAHEVEGAGALLTEAAMGMEPMAGMFPARNRLISGLSRGVVVVEAATKSGALITATHAAEQGRPVFAVPGPLDSPASEGVHQLVRKGAILIRGVEDILEELGGIQKPAAAASPARPLPEMDETQRRIWEFLHDRPRHSDEMAQHLGLTVPQLAGALLHLEMKKVVRRLPGNQYERV